MFWSVFRYIILWIYSNTKWWSQSWCIDKFLNLRSLCWWETIFFFQIFFFYFILFISFIHLLNYEKGISTVSLSSSFGEIMKGLGASTRIFELMDSEAKVEKDKMKKIDDIKGLILLFFSSCAWDIIFH